MKRTQMNSSLYLSIFLILIFLIYLGIISENYIDLFKNLIPEILGLLVTYQIIEYILKNKEKKRTEPLKNLLYTKISYILYDILHILDESYAIEHKGRDKMDILRVSKRNIIELIDYGYEIFSGDELESLTKIEQNLGEMIHAYEIFQVMEWYYQVGLDVLNYCEKLVPLTGRDDYPKMIENARMKMNYQLAQLEAES